MTAPSSESLSLTCEWDRTRFELLDRRSAILKKLDELELLAGFSLSITPGLVLDLTDNRVLEVDLDAISIYEVTQEDRDVEADEIVAHVGEVLGVSNVLVQTGFQHLVPWPDQPADAAEAFKAAANRVVTTDLGATDFALLFDAASDDGWTSQTEFGVIMAADAPARLLRRAGRAVSYRPPAASHITRSSFQHRSFADISTFVDSLWRAPTAVGIADIRAVVSEATERANAQADALDGWIRARRTPESR